MQNTEVGVPPPLVGRPGDSGESGSQYNRDDRSTRMVRVPGSSGDSGFPRESLSEEVKIKTERGIEAPAAEGSSQTREDEGSPDRQSFVRGFDDRIIEEKDRSHDLEEKPQFPPEAPSGPPRIAL